MSLRLFCNINSIKTKVLFALLRYSLYICGNKLKKEYGEKIQENIAQVEW